MRKHVNKIYAILSIIIAALFFIQCKAQRDTTLKAKLFDPEHAATLATAVFASGCFWCTEAVFERVQGVEYAISGYSGGSKSDPTYAEVSSGKTNYAEAVKVYYDEGIISYGELVEIFFASHDPTQLNRQGPDVGSQYRSAIFYLTDKERKIA